MDEYNPLNYSCEPEEEPSGHAYKPYNPVPDPEEQTPKKTRQGLKLLALVAVVAILGSIGGAILTGFIGDLKGDHVTEEVMPPEEVVQEEEKTEKEAEESPEREKIKKEGQQVESEIDIEKLMRQMTKKLWEERESCGRRLR